MYLDILNARRFQGTALLALSIMCGGAYGQVTGSGTEEHIPMWKTDTALENAPLRIEYNATSPSIIGGYYNTVSSGVVGAFIGGGGESGGPNSVTFEFSTVAGGLLNSAGGTLNGASVVSGGEYNMACGDSTTVAGGYRNVAGQAYGCGGTITSSDTVGGGFYNTAWGGSATVPGGAHNTAAGEQSFAAGSQTNAIHEGVFVWGDSSVGTTINSTAPNEFLVRAAGGLWFGTNNSVSIGTGQFIATSTGAYLSTGGTWTNNSDRNLKSNLTAMNGQSVLERLASIPMFAWNYKTQPDSVRHVGPMAQDFYAAFGLGEDDKHISTTDAEGVALAAIQELYRDSLAKDAKIAGLTAELEKLKAIERQVSALAARLSQVETGAAPLQLAKVAAVSGFSEAR
jgi:trimeric autotransporter adhesin